LQEDFDKAKFSVLEVGATIGVDDEGQGDMRLRVAVTA
jgi:hypothetical protein